MIPGIGHLCQALLEPRASVSHDLLRLPLTQLPCVINRHTEETDSELSLHPCFHGRHAVHTFHKCGWRREAGTTQSLGLSSGKPTQITGRVFWEAHSDDGEDLLCKAHSHDSLGLRRKGTRGNVHWWDCLCTIFVKPSLFVNNSSP